MIKDVSISFILNPYRKIKKPRKGFNPRLSHYWEKQYVDMFRKWKDETERKTLD